MQFETHSVNILVPGPLHQRARERIDHRFTMRCLPDLNTPIDHELAGSIRGIGAIIPVTAAHMDLFPNLEIIAHFGVGYDSVDVRHAAKRGIMVTNTPGVLTEDVADLAIALLLNAVRELPRAETWLRRGKWTSVGPYPLTKLTLRGRKAGIFGMGRVGSAVAKRLEAFGMGIEYHNRNPADGVSFKYHTSLLDLARSVDTLISVVPSTPQTAKSINAEILNALGPEGVFINIGRGATVDQEALIAALEDQTIAAAGLDVFANEPDIPQELLDLPNATLVPHVGSATEVTRGAMADLCVDNLVSWFGKARPLTPVSETAHIVHPANTDLSRPMMADSAERHTKKL